LLLAKERGAIDWRALARVMTTPVGEIALVGVVAADFANDPPSLP
jgi:hypothetical protein